MRTVTGRTARTRARHHAEATECGGVWQPAVASCLRSVRRCRGRVRSRVERSPRDVGADRSRDVVRRDRPASGAGGDGPSSAGYLLARCSAGPPWRARFRAVLMRLMWLIAWGKFPSSRRAAGSYSSDRSPTSLRSARSRSNSSVGLGHAALEREVVGQPERAREKRALAGRQPVDVGPRLVARHEAVGHEVRCDRLDRAHDARVAGRQEADERHHEEARVEELRRRRTGRTPRAPRRIPWRQTSS